MLRITIDINGHIIWQSAVYRTLVKTKDNLTVYRYLHDKRRIVKHRPKPIPLGGVYLALEILEVDIKRLWKEYKDKTYSEDKEREHWVIFNADD